eukprot:6004223-Prorocentrum_lima.AAC.1
MTSSLVGSEMCIRDSNTARPPATHSEPLARCCYLCPARQPRPSPASSVPVSYTHLTLPTICSV